MRTEPWVERPSLNLDFALPESQRYIALPKDALASGRALLHAVSTQIPPTARPLADAVRARTQDRFHPEACALADRHTVAWQDVVLANVSYDLFLATIGCSTAVIPTPDGPVVARNMDWFPEDLLARASYLVRCHRGREFQFAHAAWPASIGVVSGMSSRGFAVVLNAVTSPEGPNLSGYPVLLFLRRVLEEAPDFDGAYQMITRETLAMSGLITLCGTKNEQRVVIERSPTRFAARWGEPGQPLLATNHYRSLYATSFDDGFGCSRYERLCGLLSESGRDFSDESLLESLSDLGVIQEITAQHVIMRPRQQSMRLFVPKRLVA